MKDDFLGPVVAGEETRQQAPPGPGAMKGKPVQKEGVCCRTQEEAMLGRVVTCLSVRVCVFAVSWRLPGEAHCVLKYPWKLRDTEPMSRVFQKQCDSKYTVPLSFLILNPADANI